MRESRPYGSVRGARSNARPYRDRSVTGTKLPACADLAAEASRHPASTASPSPPRNPSKGGPRRICAVPQQAACRRRRFPVMQPEISGSRMKNRNQSRLADHCARIALRGLVRVEVTVRREDASLVRCVAAALSDPAGQAEARRLLRQRFARPPKVSLKALLASAPLEGIDLDRDHDLGRDVDL
jgi:hypothetical protein